MNYAKLVKIILLVKLVNQKLEKGKIVNVNKQIQNFHHPKPIVKVNQKKKMKYFKFI